MKQIDSFAPPTREELEAEAAVLQADPNFDGAMRDFCARLTRVGHRMLVRRHGGVDMLRYSVGGIVVALHAATGRASIAQVVAICAFARPNGVRSAIQFLRASGLVEIRTEEGDRRTRLVRPTDHMIAVVRDGLEVQLDALARLYPLRASPAACAATPGLESRYVSRIVRSYATLGFYIHQLSPEILGLMHRHGGYQLVLELIARAERTDQGIAARLSLATLAPELLTSRTQLRKVLGQAAEAGWLTWEPRSGRVLIAPAAYERLCNWVAMQFAWNWRLLGDEVAPAGASSAR